MLETGIWIKESAQGHGYGREAVAAVIKWASEKFRPSGFLYPVVDENTPSRRLAEALGGKIIGTRQRHKTGDKERKLLLLPHTRARLAGRRCGTAQPRRWRSTIVVTRDGIAFDDVIAVPQLTSDDLL